MKKPAILKLVDQLMGADESIHTVTLVWSVAAVSSNKIGRCVRRHKRHAIHQAVSSVAPSVCQYNKGDVVNQNEIAALGADGDFACILESSSSSESGFVIPSATIANQSFVSSTLNSSVDILKPAEGIGPSSQRMTNPDSLQAAGSLHCTA
ncbi:MAG: hypothetical protein AAB794_02890 [Patescibacteria group bacterium]